jgi:ABC-type antimicrobial peptide transport system permease subunit
MKAIADFIIAFLDLLEAEGRTLRRSVMRVGWSLLLMLIAAFLVLAAAGFFLAGIYQYLSSQFAPPVTALLLSFLSLLLALIIAGIAHRRTR